MDALVGVSSKTQELPIISLVRCKLVPGYLFGLPLPSLIAIVDARFSIPSRTLADQVDVVLQEHLPEEREAIRPEQKSVNNIQTGELFAQLCASVAGIQEAAGLPVIGASKLKIQAGADEGYQRHMIVLPSLIPRAAFKALEWVLELINGLSLNPQQSELSIEQRDQLDDLVNQLIAMAPKGSNNIRFIRAAIERKIPVTRLPGGVFQYGWGKNARLFKSSASDATSVIAVTQARNKVVTQTLLKEAGISVPQFYQIKNEQQALECANECGYPVVLKPSDQDQGLGVFCDLKNETELSNAYHAASELSDQLQLERFITGDSYRVLVFQGETTVVSKRIPAGVTGDGKSSIEELVDCVNQDPRRSTSRFTIMKPIEIDAEALELLTELDMTPQSIPADGEFIALKKAANVSTGGDVLNLDVIKDVHPSYRAVSERINALFRLDISGIDLVTPDITRPFNEAGAAIIEVNSKPQMGSTLFHLHGDLLQTYLEGDGTLPSVLVLGTDTSSVKEVLDYCCKQEQHIGFASAVGVFSGNEKLCIETEDEVAAVKALVIDPQVEAVIYATDGMSLVQQGVPLSFFDTLVIDHWNGAPQHFESILSIIKPHLRGQVIARRNSSNRQMVEQFFSGADDIHWVKNNSAFQSAIYQATLKV